MTQIAYNDFIQVFDPEEWDIGYLYGEEMIEVLNHPIKYNSNFIEWMAMKPPMFQLSDIFIVVVKKNYDFDYTHVKLFIDICKIQFPQLKFTGFECNYKYAAVKAGLGRYAKNSLFYHLKFQFETHLAVFYMGNQIINPCNRKNANFNILEKCDGCNDCISACPAQAINFDQNRTWVNLLACDAFCHFGNHNTIPTLKWSWAKANKSLSNLSYNDLYKITTFNDWENITGGFNALEVSPQTVYPHFPICRECTSQKRCSKYNGKYPYDWNNFWIIPKEQEGE